MCGDTKYGKGGCHKVCGIQNMARGLPQSVWDTKYGWGLLQSVWDTKYGKGGCHKVYGIQNMPRGAATKCVGIQNMVRGAVTKCVGYKIW